ncbi:MAG: tetratricopeptide repeat protein [Planctomycetota bacterium]
MGSLHRKRRKERKRGRREAERAWEAAERGDLEEAERSIRRAVEKHEEDPVLWNDLGLILWRRGKLRESEKSLRAALALRPEYEEAKANLASLLGSRGFFRQALRLEEELARSDSLRREFHERKSEEYRDAIRRLGEEEGG